MKLSDIKGERTLDVIAELMDPVSAIVADSAFKDLMKKKVVPKGMDATDFFKQRLFKALSSLLKTHKKEIITILSTLKGVTYDEYADSLTMASLFADVLELISDEEFLSFLSLTATTAA